MTKLQSRLLRAACLVLVAAGFSSCGSPTWKNASVQPTRYGQTASAKAPSTSRVARSRSREGIFTRLFAKKEGRTRLFQSRRTKKRQQPQRPVVPSTKVNHVVLASSNRSNTRVVIDVEKQKAFLLVNDSVAMVAPVSTGRSGKPTPRGSFRMTERVRTGKVSTIYGVGMPYWMRLDGSLFGVHAGYLPGYPASAGCIRLPMDAAQIIYEHTRSGTRVSIYNSWNASPS